MYKKVCQFLTENEIMYDLQFGFRQNFGTAHTLINLTKNYRQAFDKRYIGCEVFVDKQKAFDIVDHEVLSTKLNHYGIRGVLDEWFKFYLSNWQQYVSINGYNLRLTDLNYDVPQGSVLGFLFFPSVYK